MKINTIRGFRILTNADNGDLPENRKSILGHHIEAIGTSIKRLPGENRDEITLEAEKIFISPNLPSRRVRFLLWRDSVAASIRRAFGLSLVRSFGSPDAALVTGMLLGTREQFSPDFYIDLQQSGLLHLVAASGYNITILVAGVSAVVLFFIRNRLLRLIVIFLSIYMYILVAGGEASVVRAGVMGGLGFFAGQLGSPRSSRRVFALVATLMILFKPSWLSDLGYQLSVGATAGLLWLEPWFGHRFGGSSEFTATLTASAVTLPILSVRLGWTRVSLAGIIVNVPAGLLVPPIMAIGALTACAGLVWAPAGHVAGIVGRPVVRALVLIIQVGAWLNRKMVSGGG